MPEVHERPEVTKSRHHKIREARHEDVPSLKDVERSAAELFSTFNVDVGDSVVDPELLSAMVNQHHLWAAVDSQDMPVGFIGGVTLDDHFHIIEVSVVKSHQRKGIGTALMERMTADVKREGYSAITLTTNKFLPWNYPWYQSIGYFELEPRDIGPELANLMKEEALKLDQDSRCAMKLVI
ncbi:GCN5- N-acetyltransferase protein [Rutstroemia sp. NJR-2017a BVV2]|nr:GCN5- N-acetyltransferase protein [Rutstroemia sp. NJR-2017a BVV2]